jgi:hypothetical protein
MHVVYAIPVWILFLSLFLPRITLALAFLTTQVPHANIPNVVALLMWAFVPRVLMLVYIYVNLGLGGWFIAHLIALILVWGGTGRQASNRWG